MCKIILNYLLVNYPKLISEKDYNDWNVLQLAIMRENYSAVELILEKNYELIKSKDINKNSVAHLSIIAGGNEKILKLLIHKDDELVFSVNNQGQTILHEAVLRSLNVTKMLIKDNPGLLMIKDYNGNTVLHIAAAQKNYNMVSLLCSNKHELASIKNNKGESPVDCAYNSEEIIKIITAYPIPEVNIVLFTDTEKTVDYMNLKERFLNYQPPLLLANNNIELMAEEATNVGDMMFS